MTKQSDKDQSFGGSINKSITTIGIANAMFSPGTELDRLISKNADLVIQLATYKEHADKMAEDLNGCDDDNDNVRDYEQFKESLK